MELADLEHLEERLEQDPRTETWLRYAVYALIALGFGSCLLVGAGRPADPSLVPAPTTTVAPAAPAAPPPAPPGPAGSVAP